MEDVRDNPHYQALAAFVAEAAAVGVDVDRITEVAIEGLKAGKLYAIRGGDRALARAQALRDTVESYKYMLTV